jgi:hypothetical protein
MWMKAGITSMTNFADRVIERTRALGHPLCLGLDPYLDRIPLLFRRGAMQPHHPDTSSAVEEFCCRVIDLVATAARALRLDRGHCSRSSRRPHRSHASSSDGVGNALHGSLSGRV